MKTKMNESLIIGEIIGDLIIGEIVDLPKKFSKTREASIISGPQLNIIASILELLKISFEVIIVV